MWDEVIHLYEKYIGTGMIAGLLLVAVIYLFVVEKNKNARVIFLYMPLMMLALYFCPLFASVIYYFVGTEIYFRFLWLVPVVPMLAYAAVKIILSLSGKKSVIAGVAMGGIIFVSGSFIYLNPDYPVAENLYHVPKEVVNICDAIEVEGREVKAAFPSELLLYVRQYSPYVCMPYGRDAYTGEITDELYDLLLADTLQAGQVVEKARERQCHYVIFSGEKEIAGDFTDYEYKLFDTIDGYVIYEDMTIYKGL